MDSGNPGLFSQEEFTVLLFEFKTQIAQYLATLNHTSMQTLADLITFNEAHCPQEMKFYGQEIFEMAVLEASSVTYAATNSELELMSRASSARICSNLQRSVSRFSRRSLATSGLGLRWDSAYCWTFKSIISSMSLTNVSAFIFRSDPDDTAYGGEFARRELISTCQAIDVSFQG